MSDYEEYVADTDPTNWASRFEIRQVPTAVVASPITVSTDGRSGRLYRLLRANAELPTGPSWSGVAQSGMLTSNQTLQLTDTNQPAQPSAVYRLEVQLSTP